ncbi:MAG TPA: glycosyltransferase family A protein [Acidobacteriota bacterium]|nr:glycosyltransferase family A protein [Acidobacteriota bacterium]
MPQDQFTVSVIVPVYNAAPYLAEALTSLQSQSLKPFEIIVVDDGSTDDSATIAQSFAGVRLIQQLNSGPAAARNTGINVAQGTVIGFLDADDLWPVDKLETQLGVLDANPEAEIVVGQIQLWRLMDATSRHFEPFSEPWTSVNVGSVLIRRSVFDRVGLFDSNLRQSEDVDWFVRTREQGIKLVTHPEITLFYRIHTANLTSDKAARDQYLLTAVKRSLDRRRKTNEALRMKNEE